MKSVFLLQNQRKHLLNKQGEWVDGREAGSLYRTVHRDEALNQMIEVNSRDYTLRIKILECELNERGVPLLKDEDMPPLGDASTTLAVTPDATAVELDANVESGDDTGRDIDVETDVETKAEVETEVETEVEDEPEEKSASLF